MGLDFVENLSVSKHALVVVEESGVAPTKSMFFVRECRLFHAKAEVQEMEQG